MMRDHAVALSLLRKEKAPLITAVARLHHEIYHSKNTFHSGRIIQ